MSRRGILALRLQLCRQAAAAGLALTAAAVLAQTTTAPAGGIYTCIDDSGRRLTADRPIPACVGKEQYILNRDGSIKTVLPRTLTAEERTEQEAREREAALQRAVQAEAVRRDRNLTARFPNEAAHGKAREAALDTVRLAMKSTEIRLRELAAERKPLLDEAEFYKGKPLPPKLKSALDSNDASAEAQRAAAATQEAELVRINRIYDAELERLRKLWSGTPAGTLGPLPGPHVPGRMTPAESAAKPAASAR
jgi:hypothetical protein